MKSFASAMQMIGVYMNKLAVLYSLMQTQKFWHLMH
jgi:hypothetical protein